MTKKPFEEMTEIEKFRHWINLVEGNDDSDDSDYDVNSVTESVDKTQATIVIKKKN